MVSFFPSRTVALSLFGFSVHWYGIMYLLAFLLALVLLPRLQRYRHLALTTDDWSGVLTGAVLGVLIGGRLGYVLFYDLPFYFSSPLEILKVWKGGMSSHGGFLGVGIAMLIVSRQKRIPLLPLLDLLIVPTAIGLALGRIGNYINQELFGTVTSVPWAVSVHGFPGLRHPAQLYAVAKDLFIALVCFLQLRRTRQAGRPGKTLALFLILYGVLRFLVEYVRVQDYPTVEFFGIMLTRGQLYTIPIFLTGIFLWLWIRRRGILEQQTIGVPES
ncbi:MAG: prolipoprotein diacylglyceryl transferase [Candidatus Peribacteraceae bacterium]|nr:prolipoprotein diacylglyceryl transferase [Candidatus Peribacteraceae bacterium]MDD5074838.1 prolipoprotein diacylglyceryl transferase [Candidatus Peribacteraceae bacterium]